MSRPYSTVAPATPNSVVMNPAPSTRKAIANAATHDRRANSLSSPPNTSVPPATISAISEMERATGPVSDCAIRLSGVSHGRPPPTPVAKAAGGTKNSRATKSVLLREGNRRGIVGISRCLSDILHRVSTVVVPGDNQQLPYLAASREVGFLVDEDDEINCFCNETLLRCGRRLGDETFQANQ